MPVFSQKNPVGSGQRSGGLKRVIVPPKPAPTWDKWEEQRVSLTCVDGTVSIFAQCCGKLAVHPHRINTGLWTVTSVSTGWGVVHVKAKVDAMLIAEVLDRDCCLILGKRDVVALVDALPTWVAPWIGECKIRSEYVSPDPFKKKCRL